MLLTDGFTVTVFEFMRCCLEVRKATRAGVLVNSRALNWNA